MTPIEMLEELVYKKIQFTLKGTDRRTVFWQLNSPDNYDEFFGETDVPLIPRDAFGLEHTCFVAIYSLYAAAQKAYPERFKRVSKLNTKIKENMKTKPMTITPCSGTELAGKSIKLA